MADQFAVTVDFNDSKSIAYWQTKFLKLRGCGVRRIVVSTIEQKRTDRQNRYYWPCFIAPLAELLRQDGLVNETGGLVTDHDVHLMCEKKFLTRSVFSKKGKHVGDFVEKSKKLSTVRFNWYLDQIGHLLAERYGYEVPPPDIYHEKERKGKNEKTQDIAAGGHHAEDDGAGVQGIPGKHPEAGASDNNKTG